MAKEVERKRAHLTLEESLNPERDHLASAVESITGSHDNMQAESQKLEAARINGVVRMITQLQAEGKNVLSQKLALLDIRESAVASSLSEQIGRDS